MRNTNHQILYTDSQSGEDEKLDIWWKIENHLVKCMGCDTVALFCRSTNSESFPDTNENIYPELKLGRVPIDGYDDLPQQLRQIYLETLKAMDANQPILAGIGIRAIIETVCKERNTSGSKLENQIDDLASQGVLTAAGAALLHKLRIIGNKAAHEVKPHSNKELSLAMEVINHLLLGVYILPLNADEIFEKGRGKRGGPC
jgi:hypothetical protein